jgi:hypothetical protein
VAHVFTAVSAIVYVTVAESDPPVTTIRRLTTPGETAAVIVVPAANETF